MTRVAVPSPHPTSYVDVPGGRRAVIDRPGPGTPVLLVPGYLGSKEDFTPVLDGIAQQHRVVALDLAGQWQSDGSDDPAAYAPEALAADLPQVLDALGIGRAHLLGHSYGGLVSRAAVLAEPDRWASLVLLCSGPGPIRGEDQRKAIDLVRQLAAAMSLDELYDGMLAYWESKGQPLPPPVALPFQRERFAAGKAAAIVGIATGLLESPDRADELAKVVAGGLPVRVVYGENEDAWPPAEQEEHAARLGAATTVIADAGHSPAYDQPNELVGILRDYWASTGA